MITILNGGILRGATFFMVGRMPDRKTLKAFHQYSNRALSEYRTKTKRKSGITTSFLSIQVNGEIMTLIGDAAKREKKDVSDWVVCACLEKLDGEK